MTALLQTVFFAGDEEDGNLDGILISSTSLRRRHETWCHENCRGRWLVGGIAAVFEDVRDAVLFKLWWG